MPVVRDGDDVAWPKMVEFGRKRERSITAACTGSAEWATYSPKSPDVGRRIEQRVMRLGSGIAERPASTRCGSGDPAGTLSALPTAGSSVGPVSEDPPCDRVVLVKVEQVTEHAHVALAEA